MVAKTRVTPSKHSLRRTFGRAILTTLVLAGHATPGFAQGRSPALTLGDKAPELSLEFVQGEPVNIAAGAGKHVYVIEFWATWCGPCRYTVPHLNDLQQKYGDQGLVVIGISDEPPETVRPFMEEMGDAMTYRVALDPKDTTARRYFLGFGVRTTIPHAFVVDGNGRVAWIGHPANPFMEYLIQNLLADLPRPDEDRESADDSPEDPGADSTAADGTSGS